MNLTELLSGSDVLTMLDYKKLANEPQRPLLYCPGGGKLGPGWQVMAREEPGSSGSQGHGWCQAPTHVWVIPLSLVNKTVHGYGEMVQE